MSQYNFEENMFKVFIELSVKYYRFITIHIYVVNGPVSLFSEVDTKEWNPLAMHYFVIFVYFVHALNTVHFTEQKHVVLVGGVVRADVFWDSAPLWIDSENHPCPSSLYKIHKHS